jgi:hypothetical protein
MIPKPHYLDFTLLSYFFQLLSTTQKNKTPRQAGGQFFKK